MKKVLKWIIIIIGMATIVPYIVVMLANVLLNILAGGGLAIAIILAICLVISPILAIVYSTKYNKLKKTTLSKK